MSDQSMIYPNINWEQFAVFNDDRTGAFEDMCRDLFYCEYLHEDINPHSDHNNPGVEVVPILEPMREDEKQQKYISFQAKFFENTINDYKICDSLKQAVKHYKGQLDRIYLFCNKIISKNTERFRKFQAILSPANIELELVTNKDIFVLLRKHKRVADYYFQDRKRTAVGTANSIEGTSILNSVSDDIKSNIDQEEVNPLLLELIKDRIQKCKEAVCNLNFGDLKKELTVLGVAAETDKRISYYQLILAAHDREDFSEIIGRIPDELKEEAFWLKNLCKNPRDITYDEIAGFSSETKIVAVIFIFSEQHWNNILELYRYREHFDSEILKALDFHYALALFNLKREDEAHDVLSNLYINYHEPRFELFDICAQLNKENRAFSSGNINQRQLVKDLLADLDSVKTQTGDQLKGNGEVVATIEMQSCFNLGIAEKRFIDEAIERYEGYSDNIKIFDGVRFFMALCYELSGNLEKACELISQCSWREREGVASRFLSLLVDLGRLDQALSYYKEIKTKTSRVESIYLLALSRNQNEKYEDLLRDAVDKHSASIEDLIVYGFYVDDRDAFRRLVVPKLKNAISDDCNMNLQTKEGLLSILAHNGEIELVEIVLSSIADVENINLYVSYDIYKCLFEVAHKKHEALKSKENADEQVYRIDKIANRFYERDVLKKDFLQIKLMCATASQMEYSMLKYSKEFFEYTHDIQTARNIIALLYKRNESRKQEYEPYIEPLMESDDPKISIAASSALWKLGRFDEADLYIYKALYNLNGIDDFDVYKGVFGYYTLSMQRMKNISEKKAVSGNMIVTLKSEKNTWVVALDLEADFCDKQNRSLGVEHINRQDCIFNKLLGSGKQQVLKLRGQSYTVVEFVTREAAIGRYIFQKATENPDKFNIQIISAENPEELVKQMILLSDQRDHVRKLIDSYNFKDNQIGIPIDFFVDGNYQKYITTLLYLLYHKDVAYYAGEPRLEFIIDTKYIPTLSTLVLLAYHNWLDLLNPLENHIVIPESYMEFFKEQYASELGAQTVSEGSLVPLEEGKFTIIEPDKNIPEIWERIIEKCESYTITEVTDEERIAFEVVETYTWERLFGKANIDKMQLDGLIVAERENGVYLCDDLFFRKIAASKRIKNINLATLLYLNDNLDEVMPIVMELSKTNYIYTPIRSRNEDELQQLFTNLLEGKLKNAYYSQILNTYLNAWEQIMNENFSEDGKNMNDNI